ncbi:hypothetical protein TanjilG_15115 [Lupinus angustifolius]|nr:hypothetical protein TanjilG_15115 [Lupinus angustifolius]
MKISSSKTYPCLFKLTLLGTFKSRLIWEKVITSKYGNCNPFSTEVGNSRRRNSKSRWWSDIERMSNSIVTVNNWFLSTLKRSVSNGSLVNFWYDRRRGNESLCRLSFHVSSQKDVSLGDMGF